MATDGDGVSVSLARHGAGGVRGSCAGADGAAVLTVSGDGVVVYDCETQTRTRSWTPGHGHDFAVPAVYDPGTRRYFAALRSNAGADPALVSWTDADKNLASLETLIDGATARLVGGVVGLVPVGDDVAGGGCLAVSGNGQVRWFGADARKLAASSASAPSSAETSVETSLVVECATACSSESGGVLVVTARGKGGSKTGKTGKSSKRGDYTETRVATLYRAAGGTDEGRRVEQTWRVEAKAPDTEGDAAAGPGPLRVIAAAAEGNDLTLLWSNGVWASYKPDGENPGTPTRVLRFPDTSGVGTQKTAGGKRGAAVRAIESPSQAQASLPNASSCSLGGGYFALARVCGADTGVLVAVVDAKFGGVHACRSVLGGAGGGVSISALRDADATGSFRVALCFAGELVLVELPKPPPMSLASVLGSLSTKPSGPAARALGNANVFAHAAPRNVSVLAPDLSVLLARSEVGTRGAFESGAVVEIAIDGHLGDGDDEHVRNALAIFGADNVTADEASSALDPFLRSTQKSNPKSKGTGTTDSSALMPPAVLAAALDACVRCSLWDSLRTLVDAGFVTSSAAAPDTVGALLSADRWRDVEVFLQTATQVSAEDLLVCLDFVLSDGSGDDCSVGKGTGGAKRTPRALSDKSLQASRKRLFAAATSSVLAAEDLAGRGGCGKSVAAAAHCARVAAASVEEFPVFSMPRAAALHKICARPMDPVAASSVLPKLSPKAAQTLASFLATWLKVFAAISVDVSLRSPTGLPSLPIVVGWASALIDAHFTSFAVGAMGSEGGEGSVDTNANAGAHSAMRQAAERLHAACDAVGKMGGALAHIGEGAALPEHQGVLSTTYSIEVVDW